MLRTRRLAYAEINTLENASTAPLWARVGGNFYTCPSGFRAVVRDVHFASLTYPPTNDLQFYVVPAGGAIYTLFQVTQTDTNRVVRWQGDTVLEAGDALGLYSQEAHIRVYASGAELLNPAGLV